MRHEWEPASIRQIARQLHERGAYDEMLSTTSQLAKPDLIEDPEFGMLVVDAFRRVQQLSEAVDLLLELRDPIEDSGNAALVRRWKIGYAVYLRHHGRLQESVALLDEALAQAEAVGDHRSIAFAHNGVAIAAINLGEFDSAVLHWNRAIVAWSSFGDQGGVGLGHYNLCVALREWGRVAEAAKHFVLAQEYIGAYGTGEEQTLLRLEQALLLVALRDVRQAEYVVRTTQNKIGSSGNSDLIHFSRRVLGTVLLEADRFSEAAVELREALRYWGGRPNRALEAEINEDLAELELRTGSETQVNAFRKAAIDYYDKIGADKRAHRLASRLAKLR